ncbi:hypothetical protein BO86DRAFT_328023 [Aspergillus japonicus CBS 114.51]|uniref:PSI domain-containing protein n=2 Tax=Aspergillus TaxID=5052 RepID=A0A2V5H5C4_ASPV1|nr:hypothetical protein BO86DRAFT_328023 [Aspergillus japonicus CBS 114.51]PYI19369.1 hypothetical protein BO99DRAFT_481935 [Aspergillus violaceofuscus CBS 115571]RAH87562.1 hypothetical protein BO86DRAFT_328023 [Aspergillus japonicus CBS 114.51]
MAIPLAMAADANSTNPHPHPLDTPDDHLFYLCWRRQSCDYCLQGDLPCGWCAISSACVPNPSRVPILAPFGSSEMCPLGSKERWELRALPFGCHVSTVTFLTGVGGVLGTMAAFGLVVFLAWAGRRVVGWLAERKSCVGRGGGDEAQGASWGSGMGVLRRRLGFSSARRGGGWVVPGDEEDELRGGAGDAERRPLLGGLG